jgi:3-hydroxyisobutyrate dehydrogenase-like beta-hydroxyacid dehydrogenase
VVVPATEGETVAVDAELEEATRELARALAAPAVGRFVESGASAVVVADACARLAALTGRGESQVARAERLLADWRAQLAAVGAPGGGADADVREAWLGVAGLALALSAVAGGLGGEPIGGEDGDGPPLVSWTCPL